MQKIGKGKKDLYHYHLKDDEIIAVKDLTCEFINSDNKTIKAVDNFSYVFKKNQIHFIIGNSGSGKSTLVSDFNGLLKSRKGYINADGFEIHGKQRKIKKPKLLRRIVSMVFQFPEYQLFKDTIEKDISFGPKSLGIPKHKSFLINKENIKNIITNDFDNLCKEFEIKCYCDQFFNFYDFKFKKKKRLKVKVLFFKKDTKKILFKKTYDYDYISEDKVSYEDAKKYLTKLGLTEDYLLRNPFGLSGGQKRRVAIAGILAIEPKILIFDEPTAGLDPQGEQEMMDIIQEAKRSGQTVIVITHTMDHVLEIADNVIVMDNGNILLHGTPYEVFTNPILLEKTKMEIPKVINVINELSSKNSKFKQLYDLQPRTCDELADAITSIANKKRITKGK
ncbi:ATP-binding cassette domain-containing protein [Malacoplasma iowae]|uniref:ATP-binding cassette domain-containing protein n=1 Tax=Malacoplasma iowae 695 TaxID=1048830 RepID=A0A6P1LBR5_MALIO|nr:ATP-binding cassette domain-containing protein [Malacoplasma iowae]QHG89866.1 ATP-binding cassette domain-containing protein [Malacoplasma iowae 695]WPL35323.1 ATP-binding cassette domain-containing protein [Malacoplasma iowae]VEU62308.1 cobalt ABC transporter ATP-binding protein [Mycoplasmopsis fermentans]VEU72452.1 cobalt ABC transporter ATP-binding protein [Malacoplasma iowae]